MKKLCSDAKKEYSKAYRDSEWGKAMDSHTGHAGAAADGLTPHDERDGGDGTRTRRGGAGGDADP